MNTTYSHVSAQGTVLATGLRLSPFELKHLAAEERLVREVIPEFDERLEAVFPPATVDPSAQEIVFEKSYLPLNVVAEECWRRVKEKRDNAEATTFPYMGKMLDSDPRSVARILSAAQTATVVIAQGGTLSIDWTAADNTTLNMTAADIAAMPVALTMYADALHQSAKTVRELIAAAITPEDTVAAMESYNP